MRLSDSNFLWFAILFLLFVSCTNEYSNDGRSLLNIPEGFPEPEIPEDNPLTKEKIKLGKKLFFDNGLSGDFSVSCASCHIPEYAFSDTVALSTGFHGRSGERNSPSLVNIAYKPLMFRDGGVKRIETQAHAPLENALEMNIPRSVLLSRIKQDTGYLRMFARVFNEAPTQKGVNYALAAFQRTLIFGNSRYDEFLRGDSSALTENEKKGMRLFNSEELNCSHCHRGIFLTDFTFRNNGLKKEYADSGRARITMDPDDAGKFFVPPLRNVAVTAPYMFDGSLVNMKEVIEHYASGGKGHRNQNRVVKGFEISVADKKALIAFLKSLTDSAFLPHDKEK